MLQLLAVYGTLKRGFANSHWMQGAEFLGTDILCSITLYDLGPYPGARLEQSQGIEVEVFRVSREILRKVDRLEEYNAAAPGAGEYDRQLLPTRFGDAWVYLYNNLPPATTVLRGGSWQPGL